MPNFNWEKVENPERVVGEVEELGEMMQKGTLAAPACTKIDGVDLCFQNSGEIFQFVKNARAEIKNNF